MNGRRSGTVLPTDNIADSSRVGERGGGLISVGDDASEDVEERKGDW